MCPNCNHPKSRILETRQLSDGIWRRRSCTTCHGVFWTHETHVSDPPKGKIKELRAAFLSELTQ